MKRQFMVKGEEGKPQVRLDQSHKRLRRVLLMRFGGTSHPHRPAWRRAGRDSPPGGRSIIPVKKCDRAKLLKPGMWAASAMKAYVPGPGNPVPFRNGNRQGTGSFPGGRSYGEPFFYMGQATLGWRSGHGAHPGPLRPGPGTIPRGCNHGKTFRVFIALDRPVHAGRRRNVQTGGSASQGSWAGQGGSPLATADFFVSRSLARTGLIASERLFRNVRILKAGRLNTVGTSLEAQNTAPTMTLSSPPPEGACEGKRRGRR